VGESILWNYFFGIFQEDKSFEEGRNADSGFDCQFAFQLAAKA
jgi:hypothetical protein